MPVHRLLAPYLKPDFLEELAESCEIEEE